MKTKEQTLTEWAMDEIVFDYCNGRGLLVHNRDQFMKVCEHFRIYNPNSAEADGSGTVLHLASGVMMSTGAIRSGPPGNAGNVSTGAWISGPARDDVSNLADWSVLARIKQAAFLCADFLSPVMCKVDPSILARVQTILEPRNVAQFSSAKELIRHLVGGDPSFASEFPHEDGRNNADRVDVRRHPV